jgi:hypothetical protein
MVQESILKKSQISSIEKVMDTQSNQKSIMKQESEQESSNLVKHNKVATFKFDQTPPPALKSVTGKVIKEENY